MQEIKVYVSAENSVGTLRDYANAKSQSAPPLVRDVDVVLKLRLFAANCSVEPYPIAQLQSVKAWKFVMDRDFDDKTQCIFQADNDRITVAEVTDTVDETEYTYTEVSVPISNTNTEELAAWLGTSKQQTGLSAELAGYDESGNTVFVLQLEGFSVRNRLTATGTPTELPSDYWTEAQVRAFAAAEIDRSVDAAVERIIPSINDSGNWVIAGFDTGLPARGPVGDNAPYVKIQYSVDGSDWTATSGNAEYIRLSVDDGETWGGAIYIKGNTGYLFTPSVSEDGDLSWSNNGDLENPATVNISGPQGKSGAVFTPSVDAEGNISWTNNGDLENPASMNIRGPEGKRGEAFKIDATGLLEERSQYDSQPKDFFFLATDNGNVYVKQSDDSGDWSDPIPFKGDPGYTPVRETDYWTDADKAEIKSYVDEAILNGMW